MMLVPHGNTENLTLNMLTAIREVKKVVLISVGLTVGI